MMNAEDFFLNVFESLESGDFGGRVHHYEDKGTENGVTTYTVTMWNGHTFKFIVEDLGLAESPICLQTGEKVSVEDWEKKHGKIHDFLSE